jgi:hypothetical protein
VPDKRFTFDRERPTTTLEHLVEHADHSPDASRREHFEEWVRLVDGVTDERVVEERVQELMERDYSIHYHVWTQAEIFELLLLLRARGLMFDIEIAVRNEHENVFVLRQA